MKKYILIQNDGEIETNSFELIGASTKRNDTGKIGFFGSGLKYSIAYMMRNNIDFKVFSGEQELKFTTMPETLKEQTFDRICINGKPTSYTVTMGPTWKEDWFVLREVYCNALDENSCQLVKNTETVSASVGKTRIYIELTDKLKSVIESWDRYFSDERTPIFIHDNVYTSNMGNEDGSGNHRHQPVKVYPKTHGVIYRRGINVAEKDKMMYDYEMEYVNINEDRTAKSLQFLDYTLVDMIGQMPNEDYVKSVLRSGEDTASTTEYNSMRWNTPDQPYSEKWVQFSKDCMLVVKEISGRYVDEIQKTKKEVFMIPAHFARDMKKKLPAVSIVGMGKVVGEDYFSEVETTPKMEFLLKEVLAALKQMNYEVHYPIFPCEFENEDQMGAADVKEKKIYISRKTFDMGRREIAMTLMEENEHIYSQKGDETRAFQTHIFSQWLKTMENSNGLFL
jgi:hypothetical protein